jgi:hypothetical protein
MRAVRQFRVAKWACTAATLAVTAAFIASLRAGVTYVSQHEMYRLSGGVVTYYWTTFDRTDTDWSFGVSREWRLAPRWWSYSPPRMLIDTKFAQVPLWPLLLLAAIPTIWLWRCDRRTKPGTCAGCGYNLTGNVSGVCPECGAGQQAV